MHRIFRAYDGIFFSAHTMVFFFPRPIFLLSKFWNVVSWGQLRLIAATDLSIDSTENCEEEMNKD